MQTQKHRRENGGLSLGEAWRGRKGWVVSSLVLKIWEFGKCKKEEHSRKKEQHSEGMNSQSGFVVNGAW